MTRGDIADYLGLTIETVSRMLSKMKRNRLIWQRSLTEIELADAARLAELAEGQTVDEQFSYLAVTSLRLCFIGDSIVNGTGDATMLGWTGRVCAAAADSGHDITHYDLGVRGDTSTLIKARWRAEAASRLPDGFKAALVFSFGINDCVHLDGVRRVVPDETLSNTRAILAEARK